MSLNLMTVCQKGMRTTCMYVKNRLTKELSSITRIRSLTGSPQPCRTHTHTHTTHTTLPPLISRAGKHTPPPPHHGAPRFGSHHIIDCTPASLRRKGIAIGIPIPPPRRPRGHTVSLKFIPSYKVQDLGDYETVMEDYCSHCCIHARIQRWVRS